MFMYREGGGGTRQGSWPGWPAEQARVYLKRIQSAHAELGMLCMLCLLCLPRMLRTCSGEATLPVPMAHTGS